MATVSVYVLPMNEKPYLYQFQDEELERTTTHLQSLVDGYIEAVPIPNAWTKGIALPSEAVAYLIVDEEGKLKNKPKNPFLPSFLHDTLVGTILIALINVEQEGDLMALDERTAKQLYVQLTQFAIGGRVT